MRMANLSSFRFRSKDVVSLRQKTIERLSLKAGRAVATLPPDDLYVLASSLAVLLPEEASLLRRYEDSSSTTRAHISSSSLTHPITVRKHNTRIFRAPSLFILSVDAAAAHRAEALLDALMASTTPSDVWAHAQSLALVSHAVIEAVGEHRLSNVPFTSVEPVGKLLLELYARLSADELKMTESSRICGALSFYSEAVGHSVIALNDLAVHLQVP